MRLREIALLQTEVTTLEARYNEIVTRHYALQKQMGHSEGVLKGLARNQHVEELSLATHEKDLHAAGQTLVRLRERLNGLERHIKAKFPEVAWCFVEPDVAD